LRRSSAQRLALQDALPHQPRQAIGQDVAGDAQLGLEFLEMVQPVERAAQDQERPALAHRLQRRRQAAILRQLAQRLSDRTTHKSHPIGKSRAGGTA
jgi:hypothetical protein